jgi:hypothetical protein
VSSTEKSSKILEGEGRKAGGSSRDVWIFGATLFLSAFLLFQVQLIISKYMLPWFGGSAAVWTTNMLVFQVLLLAGYTYSHLISERLAPRQQGRLHLSLLAFALLLVAAVSVVWPSAITPGIQWRPSSSLHPVRGVIFITLVSIGLPFFVLSATGPLLQRWFAERGGDSGTYRLYSISNLGSLLGLLAFPFLLEPLFRLKVLAIAWSILFTLFCVGCGLCAVRATQGKREIWSGATAVAEEDPRPTALECALWFLLAACASALLLATTNQLCQEIISLPLLWVLPLALYLLSFILCFDHPRWYRRELFHPLFAVGIFVLCAALVYAERTTQLVVMPLLLFVGCMICHGELVRLKPGVKRLTSFYLAVAAGGAIGGIFVAIIAPQIFAFFTEFQISLAGCGLLLLVCLIRDEHSWIFSRAFWLSCAVVAGVVAVFAGIARWIPAFSLVLKNTQYYPWMFFASLLILSGAYINRGSNFSVERGFRFVQPLVGGLAVLAMFALYKSAQPEPGLFLGERNFYGALRIYELDQGGKALFHAHTLHGAQLNPPNNHVPMAYYGPESGIGVLLRNHPKREAGTHLRVGIIGLGAGTLAVYGQRGDYFRYYEINPQVVALSISSRPVFTYVRDSLAEVEMEMGDARLLLQQEAASGKLQQFDVLVLDAFSGDAVPVHLLTKEAFDTYRKHLRDDNSIIALHLSTRHINLLPVAKGLSEYSGFNSLVNFTDGEYPYLGSIWVFLAKRPEALQITGLYENAPPGMPRAEPRLWTDDYSDIFRLLY